MGSLDSSLKAGTTTDRVSDGGSDRLGKRLRESTGKTRSVNIHPTNIGTTRATPKVTPVTVISDGVKFGLL